MLLFPSHIRTYVASFICLLWFAPLNRRCTFERGACMFIRPAFRRLKLTSVISDPFSSIAGVHEWLRNHYHRQETKAHSCGVEPRDTTITHTRSFTSNSLMQLDSNFITVIKSLIKISTHVQLQISVCVIVWQTDGHTPPLVSTRNLRVLVNSDHLLRNKSLLLKGPNDHTCDSQVY